MEIMGLLKKVFLSVSIATISNFLQICTLWRYNFWRYNYETSQPKISPCENSTITLILHSNISKVFQDRFVKLYNKATTLCALDLHGFLISNFKFSFTSKRLKIWNDLIMIYVGKWNTCRNETYLSSQSYCKSGFSGNISMSWNTRHRFLSISVWLLHFSCKWRFANLAPIFINLARLNNAESSWVVTIALDSWVVRWITWLKYT